MRIFHTRMEFAKQKLRVGHVNNSTPGDSAMGISIFGLVIVSMPPKAGKNVRQSNPR